jgi:L-cysteate sulfo-lyase
MNKAVLMRDSIDKLFARFPRCALAHLPTPLEPMTNLSHQLEIDLWVKRDDATGLAFGGNKTRKLEYIVADAMRQQADTLLSWAGVQSNWCRQLAAAANKVAMRAILILLKRPGLPSDLDGNLLLDFLCNAEIHALDLPPGTSMIEPDARIQSLIQELVRNHERAGRRVYVAPIGGSLLGGSMRKPLGAIAYFRAAVELLEQCNEKCKSPGALVLATGSASTQAGLLVGAKLLFPKLRVIGISVGGDRVTLSRYVDVIARQLFDELGIEPPASLMEDVVVFDEYFGRGYGLFNRETAEAMRLTAQSEGVLLDPVYNGKAMVGLLNLARCGYFQKDETVIFLHTGGLPALFPYRGGLHEFLRTNPSSEGF